MSVVLSISLGTFGGLEITPPPYIRNIPYLSIKGLNIRRLELSAESGRIGLVTISFNVAPSEIAPRIILPDNTDESILIIDGDEVKRRRRDSNYPPRVNGVDEDTTTAANLLEAQETTDFAPELLTGDTQYVHPTQHSRFRY